MLANRRRTLLLTMAMLWVGSTMVVAQERPEKAKENSNGLIKEYREKLKFSCSTYWVGWGPELAFDENPLKSWFTARGDAAAFGKQPWIAVEFPHPVKVRRVTILPNREPPWQKGFTILVGRVEMLNDEGKVLYHWDDEVGGTRPNMEAVPRKPIEGVKMVRFTSIQDEGNENSYEDVAIGEMQVE